MFGVTLLFRWALIFRYHCSLYPELFRSSPLPVNIFQFCNVAKLRTLVQRSPPVNIRNESAWTKAPRQGLSSLKIGDCVTCPKRLGRRGYITRWLTSSLGNLIGGLSMYYIRAPWSIVVYRGLIICLFCARQNGVIFDCHCQSCQNFYLCWHSSNLYFTTKLLYCNQTT